MNIFISYSSKNRSLVEQLAKMLSNMGDTVLYDQQIIAGQRWWDKILDDIDAASVFIYALSPEYIDSYPCDLEYKYAQAINRYMLPVMIHPVDFKQIPSHVALMQAVKFQDITSSEALQSLVRALNHLRPKPVPIIPTPAPIRPSAPIDLLTTVIDKIIDFSVALSPPEQKALLDDIRSFVKKPTTQQNALYVLERYRKRTDLLATIADEIDWLIEYILRANMPPRPDSPRNGWIIAGVALLLLGGGASRINRCRISTWSL
ncbi:MAG TPA: toll/interleukin-1 receptor domain-containing protein [Aggregatilineales bacterium]|nr:toll/interleukin-1 receptor domain-containing protein [Aggregatilineales bacterium]